ncbi:type II toxin-antitoxin system VapC family toxin [Leptospira noguchii]|uniref:type II toxin-antitoxin system VapC family toxin n=1 Tax=Leptospira noguchii TaxID=28182 RepID=UPI0009BAE10B|nr:PIN domain-containing protein [Leptospira noguchii]UOG33457.1 PIN domain-containing protein [Leptospira noguchii]UOG44291.1 PIN domain-containing protein [Leptospira noguchii]UOG47941.1 PIN domain-containing protein [Leptospira noguchii]UOG59705.1 PIN domain-containing protein [Leptospira noguchii]
MIKVIIDTGPIVAFFDESDIYCSEIRSFLKNFKGRLVTTLAVVTEVSYLLSDNKKVQSSFIEWVKDGAIIILNQDNEHFPLIHHYMEKYSDRPIDFADASLISLSEIYGIKDILTLDSDFLVYKTKKGKALNIINPKMIKA